MRWLTVGGAGDTCPSGFLHGGLAPLEPESIEPVCYRNDIGIVNQTPRPWDIGNGMRTSIFVGKLALAAKLQKIDYIPWIACYSLGCLVVDAFLRDKENDLEYTRDLLLEGVVFCASPVHSPDDDPSVPFEGICGRHGKYPEGIRIVDMANAEDIICSVDPNSPIRKLPFFAEVFTFSLDKPTIAAWAHLLTMVPWMLEPNNPNWFRDPEGMKRRYRTAAEGIRKYLDGSAHGPSGYSDLWESKVYSKLRKDK